MTEIPTAKAFLEPFFHSNRINNLHEALIEFAKLHCEAQAKAIAEKAKVKYLGFDQDPDTVVDQDSILTAYPLHLIK